MQNPATRIGETCYVTFGLDLLLLRRLLEHPVAGAGCWVRG